MTGKTHRQFAVFWVLIGGMVIYKLGISKVNYYLVLCIMLHIGKYGARFPDVDHVWKNVADKTTPNYIINKIIHITGGKHRSWQTHSLDVCLISAILIYNLAISKLKSGYLDIINFEVGIIIITGFYLGWASHLFSDMLNGAGIRLFCWNKKKVSFVPKELSRKNMIITSILGFIAAIGCYSRLQIEAKWVGTIPLTVGICAGYLGIKYGGIRFNTGNEWEGFVYKTTRIVNNIVGFVAVIFPFINLETLNIIIR